MLKPGAGDGDEALEFYAKHTAQIEVSCPLWRALSWPCQHRIIVALTWELSDSLETRIQTSCLLLWKQRRKAAGHLQQEKRKHVSVI